MHVHLVFTFISKIQPIRYLQSWTKVLGYFLFLGRFPIHTGPTPSLTPQTMLDACILKFFLFRVSTLHRVGGRRTAWKFRKGFTVLRGNFVFPTIICFWIFEINGFWRENDVIRLTAKNNFRLIPWQVSNFERIIREELNCEKSFWKLLLVPRYDILKITKFLKKKQNGGKFKIHSSITSQPVKFCK